MPKKERLAWEDKVYSPKMFGWYYSCIYELRNRLEHSLSINNMGWDVPLLSDTQW